MKVYHYDEVTRELVGVSFADESPREPGVFLIPANATTVVPGAAQYGHTQVYDGDTWIETEDHRDKRIYEKATGRLHPRSFLGPIPLELTDLEPPKECPLWMGDAWGIDIPAAKKLIWERIKEEREERMLGGFKVEVSPGVIKWFHSDQKSRIQHLGLVAAGSSVPATPWKTMDGTFVTLTSGIVALIYQSGFILDTSLHTKAEQHKAAVEASSAPLEYDYKTGWPERFADAV